MVPTPVAHGLMLCDYVLIEQGTNNASLIGLFSSFRCRQFPYTPLPFRVFATLTGGRGDGMASLVVTQLETGTDIYRMDGRLFFADPLAEVRAWYRLAAIELPAEGAYQFTLLVDGEWVADRVIHASLLEAAS